MRLFTRPEYSSELFVISALYNYTGQNIGQVSYSAKYYAPKEAIKMIYDMWFVEYRNTTMKAINSYPKDSK